MSYDAAEQSIAHIYDSVYEWTSIIAPNQLKYNDPNIDYTTIPWIIGYQNGPLPKRPFGSFYIDNSSRRLSMNNTRYEFDTDKQMFKEITSISIQIILDLNMFGENTDYLLSNIFLTIDSQEVKDWFYLNGIRYNYRGQVSNTSTLINKRYEDRAHVNLILLSIFENINYIDKIDQVVAQGLINEDNIHINTRIA